MVILLNLLYVFIFVAGLLLGFRLKKWWPFIVALVLLVILGQVNTYLPKGEVVRSQVEEFTPSNAVMEDRLLKPEMNSTIRNRHFQEQFDAMDQVKEKE